ncbi:Rap guanine nucleotide exchange factor 2-like [Homarus americanus]|uniref:Rap guanine nucleotide exchange factor 2-like n=1 Tax=Homarus americanus TaxID=6706 RepID=A0A8J5NC23_HOMAM|nr:Rap guanine nucleotide exchange factor 2-like [Homarus americanus]
MLKFMWKERRPSASSLDSLHLMGVRMRRARRLQAGGSYYLDQLGIRGPWATETRSWPNLTVTPFECYCPWIDYPDVQLMRPGQRVSCNAMNLEKLLALEQDEITIRPVGRGAPPPPPGHHHHQYDPEHHHHHHVPHHHHSHHDTYLPDLVGSAILRGARSRGSVGSSVRDGSDTSSAYSGSDTMCHSLQSSLEPDDVDLSGLTESAVDSDEEDLAESIEDPSERTEDDIKVLLEFTQRLRAFSNMTLAVRKAMCSAMVFAVVEEAGTVLMNHGEELDSWSVIINGHVEVTQLDGSVHELHLGDSLVKRQNVITKNSFSSASFGITPTMEKLYHQGIMRSKVDDCQFVCIRQTDYYRILHQSEENIRRIEENGVLVLITEQRPIDAGNRKGNIVIKGTAERLMQQLVEVENNVDPTYVEDFLLTHRTFIGYLLILMCCRFEEPSLRDRVTRVVLLWVNNHFTDFEMDPVMMNFLEQFEEGLEREKMAGQLRLLDFACATKAQARTVTLTRPSRDEILQFSILGGYERGYGIFISMVEKGSKAEDVGLKRGDQILEVNGQSFDHMNHAKALEILRQTCHLSITVKSNLLAFKEMLMTPDNSPRPRSRRTSDARGLSDNNQLPLNATFASTMNIPYDPNQQSPRDKGKIGNNNKGSSMTTKANKFKKKVIESLMPRNNALDSQANSDDSVSSHSSVGGGLYHSHSNPDLSTTGAFDDVRAEFPEHVLKVYRATDQSARFLPVHKETTAREVVMLALQIFNINDPTGSSNYALYEITVTEEGFTKQKRLQDSLQNLAERIGLSSRYYLKNITVSQTLFPDDIVNELVRESTVYFLQLNSVELAIQLTLEDYTVFRKIEPTEYIDYLFNLKSNYGTPALSQFAELVNREMFWVVSEVCSEHNLVKRSKTIKQFIKVARQCKECKNFNSMFAILSGLGHGAVSRLKQTWERLPSKYQRMYQEMQELMDPSRNMSKYRNLVQNENIQSPIDLFTIQDAGGQPPSSALISLNQMAGGGHQIATVKRRKKSTAAPDKKKMYEEAQMVRRVKAYLSRMNIITDEERLRNMSYECEAGSEGHKPTGGTVGHSNNNNSGSNSAPPTNPPPRRRPNSPTPSTTSSTSSTSQTSDGKKQTAKFGATSPQSISKMKALAEPKTKPHHGPRPTTTHHSLSPTPSPGPPRRGALTNNNSRSTHERSHSDTHAVPVDLSAESSSVTSLSKLHKSHTSGMLLEPAPQPIGSSHIGTLPLHTITSPPTVASPLFVHAAACSAFIASVKKLSTTSNNARARKSISISNNSTPLVPVKSYRVKPQQEQNKVMLKSNQFSCSFDSSYSSNSGDLDPERATSPLSVRPSRAKTRLNLVCKVGEFSRSLPTPDLSVPDDDEFLNSTPTTEIVPVFGITNDRDCHQAHEYEVCHSSPSQEMLCNKKDVNLQRKNSASTNSRCASYINKKENSFTIQNSISHHNQKVMSSSSPRDNLIMFQNNLYQKDISLTEQDISFNNLEVNSFSSLKETSFTSQKDVLCAKEKDNSFTSLKESTNENWKDTSNNCQKDKSLPFQNNTSISLQKEIQHLAKTKQKITNGNNSGIFQRIFRSKSEDLLSNDRSKSSSKANSVVEVILSPVLTRSLFGKSHSEDFLDKAVDREDPKKYSLKDFPSSSIKELSPKVKPPKIKSFQALFASDSNSLSTIFRKKMKMSKSHNFTYDEDTSLPSRFYLEKKLSCQDFQEEMSEKRYHTLQRFPDGKETHFPAVLKPTKPQKKGEAQRVYQVNQPKTLTTDDSVSTELNSTSLHNFFLTNSIPDPSLLINSENVQIKKKCNETGNSGNLNSFDEGQNGFQTFSKKPPWFEKFKKTRSKISCQADESLDSSDQLNDSYGSSVLSGASCNLSPEIFLKSSNPLQVQPNSTSLSESVNNLMKFKDQPEVHKRIAEKLNAVIRELEEEMYMVTPSSPYPVSKPNRLYQPVRKSCHSNSDQFLKPTNIHLTRPTTLPLDRQDKRRRNSAPMLSPIEEVKTSPSSHNSSPKILKHLAVSSAVSGVLRRNSAPLASLSKENVHLLSTMKSKSLDDESNCTQEDLQTFSSHYFHQPPINVTQVPFSVYKTFNNQEPSFSHLPVEDTEPQPRSLVHPAPTTFCDHYGNENEIEYV